MCLHSSLVRSIWLLQGLGMAALSQPKRLCLRREGGGLATLCQPAGAIFMMLLHSSCPADFTEDPDSQTNLPSAGVCREWQTSRHGI